MNETWLLHCDGSAWPNPGRMGLGAVLMAPDGTRHELSVATHLTGCNNEAELRAVMAALQLAQTQGARRLKVHCDNSLVVDQLRMTDPPPVARLASLFDEARAWVAAFECIEWQWVPRHRNAEADALARAAVGLAPKPAVPQGQLHKGRNRR